jgi:DNA-directed RNA polymerase specialized sigma24 family protein
MTVGWRDVRRQVMTRGRWREQVDEAAVARQREARLASVMAAIRRELDRREPGWDRRAPPPTDAQRAEIVRLRRDEGLRYAEIARRVGCSCYRVRHELRQAGLNSCRFSRYHAARRRHE